MDSVYKVRAPTNTTKERERERELWRVGIKRTSTHLPLFVLLLSPSAREGRDGGGMTEQSEWGAEYGGSNHRHHFLAEPKLTKHTHHNLSLSLSLSLSLRVKRVHCNVLSSLVCVLNRACPFFFFCVIARGYSTLHILYFCTHSTSW